MSYALKASEIVEGQTYGNATAEKVVHVPASYNKCAEVRISWVHSWAVRSFGATVYLAGDELRFDS